MNPSGTIYVCANTNMKYQSPDTIIFANETEKKNYFLGKVISGGTFSNQMYTRSTTNGVSSTLNGKLYVSPGTSSIKVNCNISVILNADYMFYVEPSYGNKVFYNFITDVSYISDEVTLITFTEDVFMTWQNGVTIKQSFVERQTTSTDIAYSDIHEQPDYDGGQLRCYYSTKFVDSQTVGKYIVIVCNRAVYPVWSRETNKTEWKTIKQNEVISQYGLNCNRPDELFYYVFKASGVAGSGSFNIETLMVSLIENAQSGSIVSQGYSVLQVITAPSLCLPAAAVNFIESNSESYAVVCPDSTIFNSASPLYPADINVTYTNYISTPNIVDITFNIATYASSAFGGYSIKNKKLLSSPYSVVRVKNNWGDAIELEPQHFYNKGNVTLRAVGVLGLRATVDVYPVGYEGVAYNAVNSSYRISSAEYPIVPYTVDNFSQWLAQQNIANALTMGKGIANAIVTSGVNIDSALEYFTKTGYYDTHKVAMENAPSVINATSSVGSVVGNANSVAAKGISTLGLSQAGVNATAQNMHYFTIEFFTTDSTIAEQTDNLFTTLGYSIKHIADVSLGTNGRKCFQYVKTVECNITGNVPMYAKNYIADRFNHGIRMWKPNYYLDYSVQNVIESA